MENITYLFPLPNTLSLKKVALPFHIFEPRYIEMVHDAIKNQYKIAVLLLDQHGDYKNKICIAGVPMIQQKYSDGRLDIIIAGKTKCILKDQIKSVPYYAFEFEQISEDTTITHYEDFELLREYLWFRLNCEKRVQYDVNLVNRLLHDPESVINYSTLFMVREPQIKEAIVLMQTFDEKVDFLIDYLTPSVIELGDYLTPIIKTY